MPSPGDKQLIAEIKKGRLENFTGLVHRYTKPLLIYVSRKLYGSIDAEDLVQNVFLNFYKNIDRFDEDLPVLPYLYGIAKNEIKMYLRSHRVTVALDETLADENPSLEKSDLEDLLLSLPEKEGKPLQLLYEGYTFEEIAKKLKKPVSTVKTIVRRTRLKLNASYEKP